MRLGRRGVGGLPPPGGRGRGGKFSSEGGVGGYYSPITPPTYMYGNGGE